jgi:UDP-glucose-4-epimerase GalE
VRVLVTGGAGYVGSHAVRALRRAGHDVLVYDSLARGHRWAVGEAALRVGDLRDEARLDAAFAEGPVDGVLHFAALAYVGESVAHPERYWDANVAGSLALLRVMLARGVRRLVFSSSCAVYGVPRAVPVPEDHPLEPVSPYGATKAAVERALADHDRAHGLRSASLRYFNAAGAEPGGALGEAHDPEPHLVPGALEAALGRRGPLEVFGADYPTPDGTCVRDYVHVSDLADAHVRALEWLVRHDRSGRFNLGTGRGASVREVLAAVEAVTGAPVPVRPGPRRPGDPPALVADPARARAELGWAPARSDLRAIVETAWAWHRRADAARRAG